MMNAIEVKDLTISYKNMTKRFSLRNLNKDRLSNNQKKGEFQALRGVTFNIKQGDVVGIIGRNGSGKSTLLRTLAGIMQPNSGTINTFDNSVSLLALGVGFKPNISGRDNIMLSGLLMGFTEKEIKEKINEIIEFSEVEEFIDMPVRTYSSGMHSKLSFAITSTLEADIILIDEVLSVGDEEFKKKSLMKMKSLINNENTTVVMVSHSLSTIKELCNKVIWIHKGRIKKIGETEEILSLYKKPKKKKDKEDVTGV